ncbi:MAG: DUF2851 family protein, partial [Dehalococcoidales bacterium]|nr:DUF2851 family protein [Dehalococcoidales bacterium]
GPGQTLYQAIMGALGYQKNKLLFLELARRLPLHILESITRSKIPDEAKLVRLQTLLSETAGLLPPWHLFKVRPRNSPHLRLEAMSYLLLRYQEKGLLEEMVGLVKKVPLKGGHHQLETGFLITVDGRPLASDKPSKNVTLLGSGRAADIVVNVLLPFTVAWGRFTGQSELERKAVDLYRNYPRLSPNSVERHMASQLGLSSNLVNSAGRQQGLIQIYKRLCTQGKCGCCRLSQP